MAITLCVSAECLLHKHREPRLLGKCVCVCLCVCASVDIRGTGQSGTVCIYVYIERQTKVFGRKTGKLLA